eukprot:gene61177-83684_t
MRGEGGVARGAEMHPAGVTHALRIPAAEQFTHGILGARQHQRDAVLSQPLRQFDHWNDGRRQHLFVQALNGSGLVDGPPRDLMAGIDADTPSQPQGTEDEFAISPDGRTVVYSAQTQGAGEAFTNNSDLFRVSIDGATPANMTVTNVGADGSPAFSPDGRRLAWLAGRRENVGGDQAVVMVADADGSNARPLTPDTDRGFGSLSWASDGRSLLATAADDGQNRLGRIDARTGVVT